MAELLRFGEAVFPPQSADVFHVGERLHLLLHLYNPSPEDAASSRGLGILLLRDGHEVSGVQAGGETRYSKDDNTLRHAVFIETAGLEPGPYEIVAILSDSSGEEIARVQRSFTLLGE